MNVPLPHTLQNKAVPGGCQNSGEKKWLFICLDPKLLTIPSAQIAAHFLATALLSWGVQKESPIWMEKGRQDKTNQPECLTSQGSN